MTFRIRSLAVLVAVAAAALAHAQEADEGKAAAERGRLAVRGQPAMNPALWSHGTLDKAWSQWGMKEKPKEYRKLLLERYGLFPAPYDNGDLPMGMHDARGIFGGKGVATDCLACHGGRIAGQTVIGAPNSAIDVQGIFDELFLVEGIDYKFPIHFSHARGTVDVLSPVAFFMEFRAPDLTMLPKPAKLTYFDNVASDPPAWWLLKKKKTRNWNGGVDSRAVRVDMVNILSPFNTAEHIKKQESVFADIHAFIMTVESPRYPFPVNHKLATEGRALFVENCAKCHGTYGEGATYPNKLVHVKTIGTDPLLALAISDKNLDYFKKSWLGQEKGPDGKPFEIAETHSYQAPPLDGVWATAPYFHNSSVPTVYHVLNSKARPKYFTRSYRAEVEDYDQERVGVKFTELKAPPDAKAPPLERRKIYDATQPGRSNAGHFYGDAFTEEQRRAVIEYLKTL